MNDLHRRCIIEGCPSLIREGLVCKRCQEKIKSNELPVTGFDDEKPTPHQKRVRTITKFIFNWTISEQMPRGILMTRAYEAYRRLKKKNFVIPADELAFRWTGPGSPLEIWEEKGIREVLFPDGRKYVPVDGTNEVEINAEA